MPAKSRHSKAKKYYGNKNKPVVQAAAGTETPAAAVPSVQAAAAPVQSRATSPKGVSPIVLHQNVGAEIRKILILAAIMFIIIIGVSRLLT